MPRLQFRREKDVEAVLRLLVQVREEQRKTGAKVDGLRKFVFGTTPRKPKVRK